MQKIVDYEKSYIDHILKAPLQSKVKKSLNREDYYKT